VPLERRLHDAALHAPPAPVNQPHLAQTGFNRGVDVIGDDTRDVARRERVKIQLALNRDVDRALRHRQCTMTNA
jgi:hypothetical protein